MGTKEGSGWRAGRRDYRAANAVDLPTNAGAHSWMTQTDVAVFNRLAERVGYIGCGGGSALGGAALPGEGGGGAGEEGEEEPAGRAGDEEEPDEAEGDDQFGECTGGVACCAGAGDDDCGPDSADDPEERPDGAEAEGEGAAGSECECEFGFAADFGEGEFLLVSGDVDGEGEASGGGPGGRLHDAGAGAAGLNNDGDACDSNDGLGGPFVAGDGVNAWTPWDKLDVVAKIGC